jgi:polyhydroxybutyrate depolymerase
MVLASARASSTQVSAGFSRFLFPRGVPSPAASLCDRKVGYRPEAHVTLEEDLPMFLRKTAATGALTFAITTGALAGDIVVDAGRGPLTVTVPTSYDPQHPAPLVVSLHSYNGSAASQEVRMPLLPLVDEYGFLYVLPEGTINCAGGRFWNATEACCDFDGSGVDDAGYLLALIDAITVQLSVDARRVYVVGHSNGGFMSYRMACEHAGVIAAIASVAGATELDPSLCAPAEPVHVLQIHGTSDLLYGGGCATFDGFCFPPGPYCAPSAVQTVETWAAYSGCALDAETGGNLDLIAGLPGAETEVTRYVNGCQSGGSAELWTIVGGGHGPNFTSEAMSLLVEHLLAHPKPAACSADLDGSGDVGFGDILAIIGAWGPCGVPCPEDLSGNGSVDFADILAVIGAWGPCP